MLKVVASVLHVGEMEMASKNGDVDSSTIVSTDILSVVAGRDERLENLRENGLSDFWCVRLCRPPRVRASQLGERSLLQDCGGRKREVQQANDSHTGTISLHHLSYRLSYGATEPPPILLGCGQS